MDIIGHSQPHAAPAADPAAGRFAFTTAELPPEGRFETWRDLWMRDLVECEVSSPSPESFEGAVELWSAGPLAIAGVNVKSTVYDRTPALARNGNDDFSFTLCGDSLDIESRSGEQAHVEKGGGFFLAHDRSFRVMPGDDCYTCLLRIDRRHLLDLVPRGFDLPMRSFAAGGPLVELVRGYVPLITRGDAGQGAPAREMLGRHVVDLIALMLRPSRDGLEMIAGRGLKAARANAVLDAIRRGFARPDICARTVGLELGISARQVHRLLDETPRTFNEHVLELRLQRGRELLADPARNHLKVAEIAKRAGFADVTHFNRAFRARFGDTPTGARAEAAGRQALRLLRQGVAGHA